MPMPHLHERLHDSAMKAVHFFETKLDEKGSYGATATDISCYYKLPMMFVYTGKNALAIRVLNNIRGTFMTKAGDFTTTLSSKSVKPEYTEYWSYTNGWIVRAAQLLQHTDVSEPGNKFLSQFNTGDNAGFLTHAPDSKDGETDVLTTAHFGLIHLEAGNQSIALSAGNYLCAVIENQPDISNALYLRCDANKKPITNFDNSKSAFYVVKKDSLDQLYFMIGYPSAYLALLYKNTKDDKYLKAARAYLDFALTCHESVFKSNFSHKLAWAASIIYKETGEEKYLAAIEKITDHFLKTQAETGVWYQNADTNTCYDQSAEIACWFMDISNNLKQCKKKLSKEPKQENAKVDQASSLAWTSSAIKYGVMAIVAGIGAYALYKKFNGSNAQQNSASEPVNRMTL
jgi:hypothetical protein